MRDKEKQVKALKDEVEHANETCEKLRAQMVETKQTSQTSQSQMESTLKIKILQLDKEVEGLKKEIRGKAAQLEDVSLKLNDSIQNVGQLKQQVEKSESEKAKTLEQLKKS